MTQLPAFDRVLLDLCKAGECTDADRQNTPACAELIQDVATHGVRQVADRQTQTPGENEYRLNGDGLKLKYDVEFFRDGAGTHAYVVKLRLAGEQVGDYADFVCQAERIFAEAKTCRGHRRAA